MIGKLLGRDWKPTPWAKAPRWVKKAALLKIKKEHTPFILHGKSFEYRITPKVRSVKRYPVEVYYDYGHGHSGTRTEIRSRKSWTIGKVERRPR